MILLISMNLMAGTAPHLVAGTLENQQFTTWLGLQNRSGKTCTVGVQYHRGAMKLPVETLLTDGENKGNFFTKELPSHGSTRIEVSTAPGTETIFTGAASILFEDNVYLNEVGITAEYRVKPASRVTSISELFPYAVGSTTPLGQCTIANINYNPPRSQQLRASAMEARSYRLEQPDSCSCTTRTESWLTAPLPPSMTELIRPRTCPRSFLDRVLSQAFGKSVPRDRMASGVLLLSTSSI